MAMRLFVYVLITAMVLNLCSGFALLKLPKLKFVESSEGDDTPLTSDEQDNPFKLPKLFDFKWKPLKPFSLKELFVEKNEELKDKIAEKKSHKYSYDKKPLLEEKKEKIAEFFESKKKVYGDKKSKLADKKYEKKDWLAEKKYEKKDWLAEKDIKDIFENKKLKLKDFFEDKKSKKKNYSIEYAEDDEDDEEAEEKCPEKYTLKYIKPKVYKKEKCYTAEEQSETWSDPRYESDEYEIKYFS